MTAPVGDRSGSTMSVLLSSCVAMFAVGANGTAIMAALPTMRSELGLGPAGVHWTINAYLVVSGACIVMGGAASDRFGARRIAMAGLALFALASALIAVAHREPMLLAARALQGVAAALAVPSTLADIRTSAPSEREGSAIGAWTGLLMLGFSVGPLVGGALTHFASWRVIFWLNAALMAAAIAGLAMGGSLISRSTGLVQHRVDAPGFVLLAVFMVSLVVALQALPQAGWRSIDVSASLLIAIAAFACLVVLELRIEAPLFDIRLFGRAAFATGAAIGSLAMLSIMGLLLYYNLYAQSPGGLGLTPLAAGASLLPLCAALLVLALSASRIAGRFGPRMTIAAGMLLIVIGSAALGAATLTTAAVLRPIGFVLLGAGLALPYATAPRLALSALAPTEAGQGSGMINACTFLGGSIGVAAGAIAFASGGFVAVLAMLGMAGILGIVISRWIPHAA